MLRSEFEILTGIYPSETLYSVIEEFYNESKTDKHEFCRRYMMNAECLAERIQTVANELESAIEQKNFSRIGSLEAKLEAEEKRADMLQEELDKELEWKFAEHTGTNMKQEDYQKLAESGSAVILSEKDAIEEISMLFGFMPEKIQILREVQTFEVNKYGRLRVKDTYQREPLYDATDWNYIRFDCAGNQWELVNDELLAYED